MSDNTKNKRGNEREEQPIMCVWPTREESREIAKQPLQPGELVQPRITRSSQESTFARATAREN